MPNITETIPRVVPYTTTPTRTSPSTFFEDRETRLQEEETRIPQQNTQADSINTFATQANALKDEVNTARDEAVTSANVATAGVNYKGDWVAGYNTTGYSLNMSVSYSDGYNYRSKVNNNLVEPTSQTNTSNWDYIEAVSPAQLALKADKADVYTIDEADNLLGTKLPINNPTATGTQTFPRSILGFNDADRVFTIGTSTGDAIYEYVDPSGTIVGKNSNGEYWKYVDGMLICKHTIPGLSTESIEGNLFSSLAILWTYPNSFIEKPTCAADCVFRSRFITLTGAESGLSSISASFSFLSTVSSVAVTPAYLMAIGRWKV